MMFKMPDKEHNQFPIMTFITQPHFNPPGRCLHSAPRSFSLV